MFALALAAIGCSADPGTTDGQKEETTTPKPVSKESVSKEELTRRRAAIREYFDARRAQMKIVATTTLRSGHVIDWIDPASQVPDGKLATPPPPLDDVNVPTLTDEQLGVDPGERGPEGTVPVLRPDSDVVLNNIEPPETVEEWLNQGRPASASGPEHGGALDEFGHQGLLTHAHRYAKAHQFVWTDNVYGTDGYIYVANPYVWRNDEFSLGQAGVWRNWTGIPSDGQGVEVGWQDWYNGYGDANPHLFIFFTTNGYGPVGNYIGGYNLWSAGFVQYSSGPLYPGRWLPPGSELYVRVVMSGGNWWINVNNQWLGYYPGWMFSTNGLRNWANDFSWFGEVADYLADNTTTYTYMGTGAFAGSGAAYMRNLRWEQTAGIQNNMSAEFWAPNPSCWSIQGYNSASSWRTYFYFGGSGNYAAACP